MGKTIRKTKISNRSKRFLSALKVSTARVGAVLMIIGAVAGTVFGTTAPVLADSPATYETGGLEVDNIEGQVTTYKAYQIFKANKNKDGTLSNIAWSSNEMRDAVIQVIKKFAPSYTSKNAQDAADYISKAYQNSSGEMTTNQKTILANQELLNQIAAKVDDLSGSVKLTAGKASILDEGYWLVVTDGSSIGVDEDGTSPIFAIISGGAVTIKEKTTVPTVDKLILNDADNAVWTYGAEAERGQSVSHKITGTVASNLKTYDLYYYEFEDVMSKGIDYDPGSFHVTLDGVDVTSHFTESYAVNEDGTKKLSVACDNILAITETKPTGTSKLEMTYTVRLNDDCVVGVSGNPNDVKIIYSSNPNNREKSETHVVRDYLYTFGLHMEKKDRDTNVSLSGSKFTIQATAPDDSSSKGKYVQEDGWLGDDPFEFVTDEKGEFEVTGLDAGTYTLHETQCPEEYQVLKKDTQFTIEATYADDGRIASLTNTVSGNADACAGIDTTDDHKVNGDPETAAIVKTCFVNVTVGNIEKVKMPLSGQSGIALIIIAGVGIVGISAAGYLAAARKKRTEEH